MMYYLGWVLIGLFLYFFGPMLILIYFASIIIQSISKKL